MSYEALVPSQRLNSSVRGLAGTLMGTRSDAIARNAEFWIEYQLDEERYRVVTPFRLGGGRTIGEQEEDTERFVLPWQALEKGVEMHSVSIAGELYNNEAVYVRFDPLDFVHTQQYALEAWEPIVESISVAAGGWNRPSRRR